MDPDTSPFLTEPAPLDPAAIPEDPIDARRRYGIIAYKPYGERWFCGSRDDTYDACIIRERFLPWAKLVDLMARIVKRNADTEYNRKRNYTEDADYEVLAVWLEDIRPEDDLEEDFVMVAGYTPDSPAHIDRSNELEECVTATVLGYLPALSKSIEEQREIAKAQLLADIAKRDQERADKAASDKRSADLAQLQSLLATYGDPANPKA